MPVIKELHFKFFLHGAATKHYTLFKIESLIGIKILIYLTPCLTSPPTPLLRRGELDPKNLESILLVVKSIKIHTKKYGLYLNGMRKIKCRLGGLCVESVNFSLKLNQL